MIRIDFLRHGETDAGDVLLGRTDASLSAGGRDAVARQVSGRSWAAVVTSPLRRARETAEIATDPAGSAPVIDDAWREIDFGDWDGRRRADLARDPGYAAFYADPDANPPPNGEQMQAVRNRIAPALERLVAMQAGPVLVVSHGGAIRMALSLLLGLPFPRLWSVRIACATRVGVEIGHHSTHGLWGEVVEIVQPQQGSNAP